MYYVAFGTTVTCRKSADERKARVVGIAIADSHTLAGRKKVEPFLVPVKPAMLKVLHRKFAEADADTCGTNQAEAAAGERLGSGD